MKYKVVLEGEPSGGYSVYAPQLPGCASQGETKREALDNIKKAIRLYLWSIRADQKALRKNPVLIKEISISS